MNHERALEIGVLTLMLGFFTGLIVLLIQSDIAQPARILPYLTAAIVIPLIVFKLLQNLSPKAHETVDQLRKRVGLDQTEETTSRISQGELFAIGWLGLLVGSAYILGLVIGMFVSIFIYVAYREGQYLRGAIIAIAVSGIVYLSLPILFDKLLWQGLLLG
jgi:hypothetical protein